MKNNNAIETVLTISVGFAIAFLIFDYRWTLNTSIVIGVLGLISNRACIFIDFLWMRLAKVLSLIVPNILLGLIFYLFLFPIALLSKVFRNKDILRLKNNDETLWINRDTQFEKESFEKMC